MNVAEQQPLTDAATEIGRTNTAAVPDSAGKLTTPSGERTVELGGPDLNPRPDVRASADAAPTARLNFKPAAAARVPQPAKAADAATQRQRDFARDGSPSQGLALREGLLRARISEQSPSVVAQRDPSGSKSRVSGKSSELATGKLSQLAGSQDFFERHGVRKPRSDIRIPLLNLTLARRDSDYKAMMARLDFTLQNYKQALAEAIPVSAQKPEQRTKTLLELNLRLDQLERHVIAEHQALSGANHKPGRQQELLNALSGAVDDERAMLVDVTNAFNTERPTSGTSVSWQNALEFKRVGLNLGDNVGIGGSQWKAVQSSEKFGRGSFNTVQKLEFRDGSVGIFKPGVVSERNKSRPAVSEYWKIPAEQPRYEARNVASANLDRQLGGGNVLVNSEFFLHDDQLGILMEKAPGHSFFQCALYGHDAAVGRLADNPMLHRDLNKLQVMDALCGQLDRHLGNMCIELDDEGNYRQLKGIDNDASFGQNEALNDLSQFSSAYKMEFYFTASARTAAMAACNNLGLPPLVDAGLAERLLQPDFAEQARANVKGLLSARETAGMDSRIEQLQAHVKALQDKGLTVTDWESGHADNGQLLTRILAKDKHHSYSQRFIDTAESLQPTRMLNNAIGLKS